MMIDFSGWSLPWQSRRGWSLVWTAVSSKENLISKP